MENLNKGNAKILIELSQILDESLGLLKKADIQGTTKSAYEKLPPSLLDQCLELTKQHHTRDQEPIRTLHHFGLPLDSPLLSGLATIANTRVLTNIHPNNNSFKDCISSQSVVVKDINDSNVENLSVEDAEYRIKVFINDLNLIQQQSNKIGQRLLICDNYCLSQTDTGLTGDLLTLLTRQFSLRSLIVVADPADSYPIFCANAQMEALPFDFDRYCQNILDFIQLNPELTVIRHEDFIAEPEKVMMEICEILELPICEDFLMLGDVFELKENSKQGKVFDSYIKTFSTSLIYSSVCSILGYEVGFKLKNIKNKTQFLTKRIEALSESPSSNSDVKILQTEIELLNHELTLVLQNNIKKTTSYSQLGQDLWVLETLNNKKKGFFVEFGATNGILLSNSYLLEKEFDWQGICAEPNPKFYQELKKNRRCICRDVCIAGKDNEEREFILADAYGSLTSYEGSDQHEQKRKSYHEAGHVIIVKTQTLGAFLRACQAPREIDYLSIDTEGSELEILEAFDLNDWQVKLLTIEHNFQEEQRQKIRKLLGGYGYQVREEKWDDWFWRPDLMNRP